MRVALIKMLIELKIRAGSLKFVVRALNLVVSAEVSEGCANKDVD